jgi:hypothetical protein
MRWRFWRRLPYKPVHADAVAVKVSDGWLGCGAPECRHERWGQPLLDACGMWHRSECEFRACDWEPEED